MYQLIASTAMLLGGCASVPSVAYDRAAEENPPSYVAVADQVTQAPAIVDLSVTRATELGADRAGPLPPEAPVAAITLQSGQGCRGESSPVRRR